MKNIAVFASGNGSNFEAIAKACQDGIIKANLVLLFSDKKNAYVLERAKKYNITSKVITLKSCENKEEYENKILAVLKPLNIDYIFLAGYMKICDSTLLNAYPNRIINIHPALLPAFKGAHAILDAYNYGVKVFGITIHYVSPELDGGKIIAQDIISYQEGDSIEVVEEKIHALEHKLYVKTICKLLEEK